MSAVMPKRREIRNSTAEFLIFQVEGKEQGIEVYYKDKTVWCTPKGDGDDVLLFIGQYRIELKEYICKW